MSYDEKQILCNECGDTAAEYIPSQTSVAQLEGKICQCQSCQIFGKIYINDDEQTRAELCFRALKTKELYTHDLVEGLFL